jgi:hypothetical protein
VITPNFALVPTDHSYREDCIRAENRAEIAEEELANLKSELRTAHRVLDAYVSSTVEYKQCGHRLLSLAERIDALVEKISQTESDGWEKYNQQMRANEALVADIKALRSVVDDLEKGRK